MDRTRKKLIEELIRVGRLIDPAPSIGQRNGENAAELPGITHRSELSPQSPVAELEGLPVKDDVVDLPYTTKDMFSDPVGSHESKLAITSERQQPAASKSLSDDFSLNESVGSVATVSEGQLGQEATTFSFPVEELARELVTLIEDRVSLRSGEQLDDIFRDELTQAVTATLESWLKYD